MALIYGVCLEGRSLSLEDVYVNNQEKSSPACVKENVQKSFIYKPRQKKTEKDRASAEAEEQVWVLTTGANWKGEGTKKKETS